MLHTDLAFSLTHTLAQNNNAAGAAGGAVILLIQLAILVVVIAGLWKTFTKAGHAGWLAIIPIVNLYFLCKIAGRPGWWLILFLIPIVNIVVTAILCNDIAKSFGKGILFAVGLFFLAPIFYCILGFGSAQYQGPAAG
jgi:hypothetical protein